MNEKFWILIKISLKFVPRGPIDKYHKIGLDNGLAPNRRQVIIWNNADPIHWRICVALQEDEFRDTAWPPVHSSHFHNEFLSLNYHIQLSVETK